MSTKSPGSATSPPTTRTRRTPPPPPRQSWSRSRLVVAGIVVVALIAAVVVGLVTHGSSHSQRATSPNVPTGPTAGSAWETAALGDFNPMKGVLLTYVQTVGSWQIGKATSSGTAAEIDHAMPEFLQTRLALSRRQPLAQAPRALDDYREAVQLYIQSARIAKVGTAQPAGALQDQLKLLSTRVRDLADRVFDQAAVELAPYLPAAAPLDGIVLQKPADVPSWPGLKLAAGAPLDTATTGPTRRYQNTRPTESLSAWKSAVGRADVPSTTSVTAAIGSGSLAALRTLSDQFTAASNALYADPDPKDGRLVSTRLQLGLLIDAEGMRSAEASTVAAPTLRPQLVVLAKTLTLLGDDLWDPQLGPRTTGFDPALLTS